MIPELERPRTRVLVKPEGSAHTGGSMKLLNGFEIWQILMALLIPSFLAALCYALVRTLEKVWPIFPHVSTILFAALYICFLGLYFNVAVALFLGLTLLLAVVSGYFHRRAGGVSSSSDRACAVMLFNFWLCFFVGGVVGGLISVLIRPQLIMPGIVYATATMIYPYLAPLALWIWQSLRVRPGVDESHQEGLC